MRKTNKLRPQKKAKPLIIRKRIRMKKIAEERERIVTELIQQHANPDRIATRSAAYCLTEITLSK